MSSEIICCNVSMAGTAHINKGGGNEDYSASEILDNGWALGIIADGVGSCPCASIGSRVAVEALLQFVNENIAAIDQWNENSLCALLMLGFHIAFLAVKNRASNDKRPITDYDTTLSISIYNGGGVVYGHVGDGGIIYLNQLGNYNILSRRMKGEFSNEVIPLSAGPQYWDFGHAKDFVVSVSLMTDGLFDIASPPLLSMEDNPLYIPFLRSFMDVNANKAKNKTKQSYSSIIEHLLNSLEKVTDDKTLVLMINKQEEPDEKNAAYYAEPDWEQLLKKQMEYFDELEQKNKFEMDDETYTVESDNHTISSPKTNSRFLNLVNRVRLKGG